MKVYGSMCIGFMQILCHLSKGLERPHILVDLQRSWNQSSTDTEGWLYKYITMTRNLTLLQSRYRTRQVQDTYQASYSCLDLFVSSFSRYLLCVLLFLIWDLSSFLMHAYFPFSTTLTSCNKFWYVFVLFLYTSIFFYTTMTSFLTHGLFRCVLLSSQLFGDLLSFYYWFLLWSYCGWKIHSL